MFAVVNCKCLSGIVNKLLKEGRATEVLRDNSMMHEADISPAELYAVMLQDEQTIAFVKHHNN